MDASINIFEAAFREKLRFTYRGVSSVEDLWDLPVEELDNIYKDLRAKQKETEGESLISTNKPDFKLELSVAVVKHIVEVKLAEAEDAKNSKARREQKKALTEVLARRQVAELESKTPEEIQAMIDAL